MSELKDFWLAEEKRTMIGWDFSNLDNRWEMEDLPWDYFELVKKYNIADFKLLDMGTGGGELLLQIKHPYNNTFATEGYRQNYELCKETLEPLGITIRFFENDIIPYEDEMFDLVINRHESYNPLEVYRVLKPNGVFITQQVGNDNNKAMSEFLIGKRKSLFLNNYLPIAVKQITDCGFRIIESDEIYVEMKYFDIGALVYYAKIIEWEFAGFSVEKCYNKLVELQNKIDDCGYVGSTEHRYYLVAKK